jgi:hypothetical protein
MQAGDWMNYTVDVAQPGSYTLTARNSYWGTTGGTFHVEADGVDATGPLQLGGGNVWQTLTKPGVQLNAGRHVLHVVCDSNGTDGYYEEDGADDLDAGRRVAALSAQPAREGLGGLRPAEQSHGHELRVHLLRIARGG